MSVINSPGDEGAFQEKEGEDGKVVPSAGNQKPATVADAVAVAAPDHVGS